MAECLVVGQQIEDKKATSQPRGLFVCLDDSPKALAMGTMIAESIVEMDLSSVAQLEQSETGSTPLYVGAEYVGRMITSALPSEGVWPVVGIRDTRLAQCAYSLAHGSLLLVGQPSAAALPVPVVPFREIAEQRAPYHADIYWNNADGKPRGPFNLIKPSKSATPEYPMLWGHDTKAERTLEILHDSEGTVRYWPQDQEVINEKAATIWSTATRLHYNRDLGFNAQSIIVAVTDVKCIGGASWPSVILDDPGHAYAVSLWCNSTLGLLLHWWVTNKTQSGRGRTSVTAMPNIPTLDTRALTDEQHAAAREAFEAMRELRFLPFDQIDEDPARAELDRRLLVDVLGLPASLCEEGGPIDLLRRKLAREPQIHGGKKSRVVFTDGGEKSQRRHDRD